jgi:hypothetical protein
MMRRCTAPCPRKPQMTAGYGPLPQLLQSSSLLVTESKEQFDQIRDAFLEEIKPRGMVEHMYVSDVSHLTLEILRLRRARTSIISLALRPALEELVPELLRPSGEYAHHYQEQAEDLAQHWYSNEETREHVRELLGRYGLDESAIEAQAMRKVADSLGLFDRLLASAEARRGRALRGIAEYRNAFAQQLRATSDQIIDGKVLSVEHAKDKEPSAAA